MRGEDDRENGEGDGDVDEIMLMERMMELLIKMMLMEISMREFVI